MGTLVEITLPAVNNSSISVEQVLDQTTARMKSLEQTLSIYNENSDISALNSLSPGEFKKVSPETYTVIKKSLTISKITGGTFDITVAPLLKLWHFEKGKLKEVPSDEKIKEALAKIGWTNIILAPQSEIGFSKEDVQINLGGIAKGYIVDEGVEILKSAGIESALLNAGGDIYCLGEREKGTFWKVGIRHPRKKGETIGTLKLKDQAVATSGDYEKFFTLQGRRYSHIINPSSGYPVDNSLIQSTVIAPDCTQADALATALLVMGKKKSLALVESLPEVEAVVVEETKNKQLSISYTSGLKGNIEIYE